MHPFAAMEKMFSVLFFPLNFEICYTFRVYSDCGRWANKKKRRKSTAQRIDTVEQQRAKTKAIIV